MTTRVANRQLLTSALNLFYGRSRSAAKYGGEPGIPLSPVTLAELGAPATAVADALIKAATSTELPDTATKTYTFPSAAASPQDGSLGATGILDVARNLVFVATHATAVVAMSILATGKDENGQDMTELFTITAGTTSKTATGKKAFKQVTTIAITAAADATANSLDGGTGVVLGLPFKLTDKNRALYIMDGVLQTTLGTVTVADDTTPANNTGDVRGTWSPNSAANGTRTYALWMVNVPADRIASGSAYGKTQA